MGFSARVAITGNDITSKEIIPLLVVDDSGVVY